MTTSPSSLMKGFRSSAGRRSRTASEGRHSFTPSGDTTIGRFRRTGWASIASRSWSSVRSGAPRPSSAKGVPFSRRRLRSGTPMRSTRFAIITLLGGVFRYSTT
ncbi:hypothetical protein D3C80_1857010 [compost metagenome]